MTMARILVIAACIVSTVCAIGSAGSAGVQYTSRPQSALQQIDRHEFLQEAAPIHKVPIVKHDKEPGNGYMPGSPLFNKQVAFDKEGRSDDSITLKPKVDAGKNEGKGKKESKKEEAISAEEKEESIDHHGALMAVGMFATVALLSMVIALTSTSNKTVNSHTWQVVDQVILIFIAVMNYQAFGAILNAMQLPPVQKILAAGLQAFMLFLFAFFISWKMKADPLALGIFCGAGAHFVSFASQDLCEKATDHYAGEHHLMLKLLMVAIFAVLFFLFSCGVYVLKRQAQLDNDEWDDAITDTENDFISMAMAVVWTMFVFHLIFNKDFEIEVAPKDALRFDTGKELIMLAYAVVLVPIAILVNKSLAGMDGGSMLLKRIVMFFGSFFSMASCWAFLVLGQMHYYSRYCSDKPLFCRIVFAVMTNVFAAVTIIILAKMTESDRSGSLARAVRVVLMALSLGAAWSWEQTFDAAMELVADDQIGPFKGHSVAYTKCTCSILLVSIILPTYVMYIKPIANSKTARLG